jgi:ribosomal protein L15E
VQQQEAEAVSVERMASPFASEKALPNIRKTVSGRVLNPVSAEEGSDEKGEETKEVKRKISSTKMSRLCKQHAFSQTQIAAQRATKTPDALKVLDSLHPIDRYAYPPVDRRNLYEPGLGKIKKKALSK